MAQITQIPSRGKLGAAAAEQTRALLKASGAAAGAMGAFEQAAAGAASELRAAAGAAAKTAKATARATASAARYVASFDEIERLPAAKSAARTGSSGSGKTANTLTGQLEQTPALLSGLGSALSGFWRDFSDRLTPAASAWAMAWQKIRQAALAVWQQISAAAGALWQNALAPLLSWLGQIFAPGLINSFSRAFAPITGDLLVAGLRAFGLLFQSVCGGVQQLVRNVLTPALALALQIWRGLMTGIQGAWASWGRPILTAAGQAVEQLAALAANLWQTVVQPVLRQLMAQLQALWTQHLKPLWDQLTQLFGAMTNLVLTWWNQVLLPFLNWLTSSFGPMFSTLFAGAGSAVLSAVGVMADAVSTALQLFQGLAGFMTNVFAGNWKEAWTTVQNTVTAVWNGIQNTVRGAVNGLIGMINRMLQGAVAGINALVRALNSLSFTIPKWVPGLGGARFGLNLGTVSAPQIPLLAGGGVIRQPTLAMMGEYPGAASDPEIAAPQSAIARAVSDANGDVVQAVLAAAQQIIAAIRENGGEIVIGDEVIGRAARRYSDRQTIITGGAVY